MQIGKFGGDGGLRRFEWQSRRSRVLAAGREKRFLDSSNIGGVPSARTMLLAGFIAAVCGIQPMGEALANGWYESRPWQFDTSADKANKAAVVDMIERKKGGYYDGFSTTINNYNNTNVGTQINCNNVANATGNEAANSQVANSPTVTNTSGVKSSATGNEANNSGGGDGPGVSNGQENSGTVSSGVTGSTSSSATGPINGGPSRQGLNNQQTNSGNQQASINGSTACDMTGSTVNGNVNSAISGPLN
jgi:hypothetical protein